MHDGPLITVKDLAVYCAASWSASTWITTGVKPLTCPPLDATSINPLDLVARIIYIRLHGISGQPYLYGDGLITALTAKQVAALNLAGALVFLEGCHSQTMAQAFLAAGAASVTGCEAATFGRRLLLGPSSVVGRAWLRAVQAGKSAQDGLKNGLARVPEKYAQNWYSVDGSKNS